MREVEIQVYNFSELSEEAQKKVYDKWLEDSDYPMGDDNAYVLKQFERIFPVKVVNYEYGNYGYTEMDFKINDERYNYYGIEDLEGVRLYKFIYNNFYDELFRAQHRHYKSTTGAIKYYKSKLHDEPYDCPLTGYYMDYEILKPLYEYLEKPNFLLSLWDLMDECLQSWVKACDNDYDNYYSWENFVETEGYYDNEYYAGGEVFAE